MVSFVFCPFSFEHQKKKKVHRVANSFSDFLLACFYFSKSLFYLEGTVASEKSSQFRVVAV